MTTPEMTSAEAQEAEATASPYMPVIMDGYNGAAKEVRALPATRWRASALRALNSGDMDAFMQRVLHEDDYALYEDLDPDTEQIGAFAERVSAAAGEALGKSSGPRGSSRTMRKR